MDTTDKEEKADNKSTFLCFGPSFCHGTSQTCKTSCMSTNNADEDNAMSVSKTAKDITASSNTTTNNLKENKASTSNSVSTAWLWESQKRSCSKLHQHNII